MSAIHFRLNSAGRDFVVGDIHGHFSDFDRALEKINFDSAIDRVFSVGDLIDRGPESELALTYLAQDWFFPVRGNHEELLMAARNKIKGVFDLWMRVGGFWAQRTDPLILDQLADAFSQLPYMIQVETPRGNIGIVHADLPENIPWPRVFELVKSGAADNQLRKTLTWSRDRFKRLQKHLEYPGSYQTHPIEGIEEVYVGHSIVDQITRFEGITFIDTGQFCGGKLSLINLHDNTIHTAA